MRAKRGRHGARGRSGRWDESSSTDTSVEGFNRGGSLHFEFAAEKRDARAGTRVSVTVRLPLPPVIGSLIKPLLEGQIRKELLAAVAEDKHDLEVRGYRPGGPARALLEPAV